MQFKIINEQDYIKFLSEYQHKNFLQTVEIGKLREHIGWKIHYVGVVKNNCLIGATMLVSRITHFGKSTFYAPRGFLIDYSNIDLLKFFTVETKKYIKKQKGYELRIDPYLPLIQLDTNGEVVKEGFDNRYIVTEILRLGFKKVQSPEQANKMYVLDVLNKTNDQVFQNMKPNTRNNIRKTMKLGIEVEELTYEQLNQFYQIMVKTSERKHFDVRTLKYYQRMYQLFHPNNEVKFLIAKLNLENLINELNKEMKELEEKRDSLSSAAYNEGKRKNLENDIGNVLKRILFAKKIMDEDGKEIVLSASMFMLVDPEVIYLFSGNDEKYFNYNSQYLIQWKMIQYAIEHNFSRYNFYGLMDSEQGVYEFKKGFNGYVEELIGEYILPITKWYSVFKFIHKIKK